MYDIFLFLTYFILHKALGSSAGGGELLFSGYGVSVWDDENLGRRVVMIVQHYEYT